MTDLELDLHRWVNWAATFEPAQQERILREAVVVTCPHCTTARQAKWDASRAAVKADAAALHEAVARCASAGIQARVARRAS